MGRIVLLEEHVVNKIAAGEVIERPASIVKELVENSIDAGSTRIEICITDGGFSEITVSDNGSGIAPDDAVFAFERHATSKIKNAADLENVLTLGFRGEALSSIAAVSRLNLRTRTADSVSGTGLDIEGGNVLKNYDTASPQGTILTIRDLFFNTPARRKHMKTPNVEAGHVSDVINKFAMGYPEISFQLKTNGRLILKTPAKGNLRNSIAAVYGTETAREMLALEGANDTTELRGYIGKPSLSRASRHYQTIYINGRFVRNRIISEAVEKAYHSMLMTGRYPVFIVKIGLNPSEIDVNVHPAKTEVRILDNTDLAGFITEEVSRVLSESRLIPAAVFPKKMFPGITPVKPVQQSWQAESIGLASSKVSETPRAEYCSDENFSAELKTAVTGIAAPEQGFPSLKPLGQINGTFIAAQGDDGMYLIDQHAAHERILYEKFMARPDEHTVSEQLLFPVTLELTHQEVQTLNENILSLTDLGFVVEHFGGDSFIIRAIPAAIIENGAKEIFLDLLDYFSHNRNTISGKTLKEKLLITMACKSAIKAGDRLGMQETESLLSQLAETRNPYTCPHGRPTLVHFSGYDLEKMFKRVL
ncbi:DNA mismatch repair endonuclease MutL [Phosphitispora sp. TUW77]|uniref:DNA mismatch repair endonuclease MutL n=1 Tax=Phosphitispora sp. TUW77 TaxID=3152361 RepID=UPI003AB7BE92